MIDNASIEKMTFDDVQQSTQWAACCTDLEGRSMHLVMHGLQRSINQHTAA